MQAWQFPEQLPVAAQPYVLPETQPMLEWIRFLHMPDNPVQIWSWWQLFLDAWLHIPMFGPWYHANQHKWKAGSLQPSETFQRKARWFSQYVTKLAKACHLELPLQHRLPSGSTIAFWTKTLTVRAPPQRTHKLDQWFGHYFACASKTADLKQIHM